MVHGLSFRLLYRVVFACFCLIFACFYPHGGGLGYDSREDETESNKLQNEFKGNRLNDVFIKQDEYVSNLTENAKKVDGGEASKKAELPKMVRKETVKKTPRSDRTWKSAELPFSTPAPEVPSRESTTISRSNETKSQNRGGKNLPSLENQIFHKNGLRGTVKREKFASLTSQHIRSRQEIDAAISKNNESSTECANFIFTIKYEDEYKVWNDFSILYKNKVYDYTEYRVLNDGIKICNSTDNDVRNIWKVRNWVKATMHFKSCNKPHTIFFNYVTIKQEYYVVSKQFTVYLKYTGQNFTRNDYRVRDGELEICEEKLGEYASWSTEYTQEDLLMCDDSIINIKYDDEYKVWTTFSILYKNKTYDYTEYRVLNGSIKICNSTDNHVMDIWKLRNYWVKMKMHFKSCNKPITYTEYNPGKYTVLKDFSVLIQETNQVIPKYDYGVEYYVFYKGILVCDEKLFFYITNIKIIIVPLCALALSFICLLLLLIIYCMLPELRTLPGLNLMSLSLAFLLWQTYLVAFLSLYSRVGKLLKTPCDRLFITTKFITYSILMNAAVNIYHLRKTFCGNTLVKADVNKWKRFLKYSLFSWGIPVIITIVYIILVKVDVLRFDEHVVFIKKHGLRFGKEMMKEDVMKAYQFTQDNDLRLHERIVFKKGMTKENNMRVYEHITGDCISGRITPDWSAAIDVYGFQGCLVLYILVMFFLTAYRIRQKLKASSSIAQKSNIAKNHKFVILVKLSTTTAVSYWFPLFISEIVDFSFDIKIALYTVTLLTGAYIGIAFGFTRRNYTLLKKKYSPVKHKSVSKIAQV